MSHVSSAKIRQINHAINALTEECKPKYLVELKKNAFAKINFFRIPILTNALHAIFLVVIVRGLISLIVWIAKQLKIDITIP